MLEKPDLPDEKLIALLQAAYDLHLAELTFLPLGADADTAVYRAVTADETPYFLKLWSGVFAESSVAIPRFLHDQGIGAVIPPIPTTTGRLWTSLERWAVILSPFVPGRNGFEVPLSDGQWHDFGIALRGIHAAALPEWLRSQIPQERYSPVWRDSVRAFQDRVEEDQFTDTVAAQLAVFMRSRRPTITDLVLRAERLGNVLRDQARQDVLCHGDIHAGNILIGADGTLHIVDWDTAILAPKERDLMFVGAGIGGVWQSPREAELFYAGYGEAKLDPVALAYYRYERIVEDIAAFCDQVLPTDEGGADRAQALEYLLPQFEPNGVVDIAYRSDAVPDPQ